MFIGGSSECGSFSEVERTSACYRTVRAVCGNRVLVNGELSGECYVACYLDITRVGGNAVAPFYEMVMFIGGSSECGSFSEVERTSACYRTVRAACGNRVLVNGELCGERYVLSYLDITRVGGNAVAPFYEAEVVFRRCGERCGATFFVYSAAGDASLGSITIGGYRHKNSKVVSVAETQFCIAPNETCCIQFSGRYGLVNQVADGSFSVIAYGIADTNNKRLFRCGGIYFCTFPPTVGIVFNILKGHIKGWYAFFGQKCCILDSNHLKRMLCELGYTNHLRHDRIVGTYYPKVRLLNGVVGH